MPAAKRYLVGYKAYRVTGYAEPDLLAIGKLTIMASSVERAMELAVKQVPSHIHEPKCQVGIRFVKEIK